MDSLAWSMEGNGNPENGVVCTSDCGGFAGLDGYQSGPQCRPHCWFVVGKSGFCLDPYFEVLVVISRAFHGS